MDGLCFHIEMKMAHYGSLMMVTKFVLTTLFQNESEIPSNPDYVPSMQSQCDRETNAEDQSGESNLSLKCFKRV